MTFSKGDRVRVVEADDEPRYISGPWTGVVEEVFSQPRGGEGAELLVRPDPEHAQRSSSDRCALRRRDRVEKIS